MDNRIHSLVPPIVPYCVFYVILVLNIAILEESEWI